MADFIFQIYIFKKQKTNICANFFLWKDIKIIYQINWKSETTVCCQILHFIDVYREQLSFLSIKEIFQKLPKPLMTHTNIIINHTEENSNVIRSFIWIRPVFIVYLFSSVERQYQTDQSTSNDYK